jgi:hypothetical protein
MVRDLKRGESRTYRLVPLKTASGNGGVTATRDGANVDLRVGNQLVTRYDTTTGPTKPYFYPVNAPGGKQIVRHWPVEPDKIPGETHDHPHHRGISFTHGEVNGADFWLEDAGKAARTVHTGYEVVESGPIFGHLRARTDWLTREGKKIAEDTRDFKVYNTDAGYLMDFDIAVKASGGPLHWGDTKEGTFAIRVADSLRPTAGQGQKRRGPHRQ